MLLHLDVETSLRNYNPRANRVPSDLHLGPFEDILAAEIDPILRDPIRLTRHEFRDLVEFVRDGLFDSRVNTFCRFLPEAVPSGQPLQRFEGCHQQR
jgi:hypothetical protein